MLPSEDLDTIRPRFLAEDAGAIATVGGWIGHVLHAQWALADAESLQQDILTELITLARAGRIRTDADFRVFVRRVARLRAIDAFRAQRIRPQVPLSDCGDLGDTDQESSTERMVRRERAELAKFIFQTLTPACREVLRWLFGEERSHAWIAEQLGVSQGAARVRAHRCIERACRISKRFAHVVNELIP